MHHFYIPLLCLLMILILAYVVIPGPARKKAPRIVFVPAVEQFNTNFYNSVLEADMDSIKDNKGYTLDDYVLYDHMIYGSGIETPIPYSTGA